MPRTAWIALDWGGSRLRAWRMGPGDAALEERRSDAGAGSLAAGGFEAALLDLVGDWLTPGARTETLACGMVGAKQGWVEAPYRALPCAPAGPGAVAAPCADPRLSLRILPGLSQARPRPDVMRGEETQIAGFLAAAPDFDGVVVLPGTHSKWVHVSAGEAISFQTFLTGELFALLSEASVLRHSMPAPDDGTEDGPAFLQGVEDAMDRPQDVTGLLFAIRAAGLLDGLPPAAARARLSGLLIGMELAGAKPWWLGREVALVGAPALCARYAAALRAQGLAPTAHPGEDLALAGLVAARRAMESGEGERA
ncbi:2-dehydro-3-deoxygalactonokinase [Rhodovulum sp. DZ06]|uniref:2-dehydro-3-deoxygalactonokinase n=1 Tax=Rhodovulum sp. DZ06 TaxID=3425126 RepID=UPI003D33B92E